MTQLISPIEAGEASAKDRLVELVFDDLRAMAEREMRGERADHTLRTTALVHESYIRLEAGHVLDHPKSRKHFFGAAARAMKQVLTDYARKHSAKKRGGTLVRLCLDNASIHVEAPDYVDAIALHNALEKLRSLDARQHEQVLHRFNGLSRDEIAEQLGVSLSTVDKDWRFAKAWLTNQLSGGEH